MRPHILPPALAVLLLAALGLGSPLAPAAQAAGEVPLDRFFGGAVVGLEGSRVRLRYDFSDANQAKDWAEVVPWPIAKDSGDGIGVSEGRLSIRGSTGARHVAEWDGDLSVTCRLIPDGTKDIGGYLSSPDALTDYVTYSIAETYFHAWDNNAGGLSGMMKFGKQYSTTQKGGYVGFRYLDFRRPQADPAPGKVIAWTHGRRGTEVFMTMDDLKLDSQEPPNRMKVVQPGFYAIKSSFAVDDVVIEGTLSARFVAGKKLALRTEKPIVPDVVAAIDPAVKAILDGYAAGKEGPAKVVALVGDPARSDADRGAAAAALRAGPRKSLPAVLDLLYSADLRARTLGIEIVKSLAGKAYGYDPKASEKSRQAAIRKLNEDIAAHPEMLQGVGGS